MRTRGHQRWRPLVTGLLAGVWFALAGLSPVVHESFHRPHAPAPSSCSLSAQCADADCPICRFATARAVLQLSLPRPVRAIGPIAEPTVAGKPLSRSVTARGRAPPAV